MLADFSSLSIQLMNIPHHSPPISPQTARGLEVFTSRRPETICQKCLLQICCHCQILLMRTNRDRMRLKTHVPAFLCSSSTPPPPPPTDKQKGSGNAEEFQTWLSVELLTVHGQTDHSMSLNFQPVTAAFF